MSTTSGQPRQRKLLALKSTRPSRDLYADMYYDILKATDLTYLFTDKFPRRQKYQTSLAADIRGGVDEALRQTIRLASFNPGLDPEREALLRELSVQLKFVKVLIRIAHRDRYVSNKQFQRWTKAVSQVDDIAIGLAIWYQNNAAKVAAEKGVK